MSETDYYLLAESLTSIHCAFLMYLIMSLKQIDFVGNNESDLPENESLTDKESDATYSYAHLFS